MDWLRQAAVPLRNWLTQHSWLDGWQSSIANTPDWALLAAGPATLLLITLLLRITWSRARPSNGDANLESAPTPATRSPPVPAPVRKPAAVQPVEQRASAQMAHDDEDNRSVRVFVSSTFLDMQTERDELVTKTFPALRAKYRARGVEVFEVDLRWGITREQQERGETLPTLLAEIDRCRPYFIGLLGDRYGWVPPAAALTDKLKADYPVLADADGASVTAIEIMHGVLSNPDTATRACFFERDPSWNWRATLSDADRASAGEEPEAARDKLADLRAKIGEKVQIQTYARPEEIGTKVAAALDTLLEARFPEAEAPDEFEQTARLHRAYARERRNLHVGGEGYMRDLNRWMETKDAAPLLITGVSGGGKSTLVANWLNAWRKAHPNDFVFEHYLGASPDSAEPMLIMRRLWECLDRATGEVVEPPDATAEPMEVSAALAQRLAGTRVSAERSGARVLIALDGFDKLSSEQNLRWLPITPGTHCLASSLSGEAETAARARGFAALNVKPLSVEERQAFIAGTLKRWRRELEPQHIARILQPAATELAGSPLYLKTVLEELRVSADNARLTKRLEDYRGARDMPELFDRVLQRLEDDCEPGLVATTLPFIWASRAGLAETEILAITGASPLAWATLRNGLGDGLRDGQGRVAFGHDFISQAVAARYLNTDEQKRAAHLALADHFGAREPDARQAEELPYQLRAAEAWERLEALLVDLDRFVLLRARGDGELWSYWLPLNERGADPENLLCDSFEARVGGPASWTAADLELAFSLGDFFAFVHFSGVRVLTLVERRTAASKTLNGIDHPETLRSMGNEAAARHRHGDLVGARRLEEEVLDRRREVFGPMHPEVFIAERNLCQTMRDLGDVEGALALGRTITGLVAETLLKQPDLPVAMRKDLLHTRSAVAGLMMSAGKIEEALAIYREIVPMMERYLGPDHVATLIEQDNLAAALGPLGQLSEARSLNERATAGLVRLLGPDHPTTVQAMANGRFLAKAAGEGQQETLARVRERHLALMKAGLDAAAATPEESELAREMKKRLVDIARRDFADAVAQLAEEQAAVGELEKALASMDEAIGHYVPLCRKAPMLHVQALALALDQKATILARLLRTSEAHETARMAVEASNEVVGKYPHINPDCLVAHGRISHNFAARSLENEHYEEGMISIEYALNAKREVHASITDVARTLAVKGMLLTKLDRKNEAAAALEEALSLLRSEQPMAPPTRALHELVLKQHTELRS